MKMKNEKLLQPKIKSEALQITSSLSDADLAKSERRRKRREAAQAKKVVNACTNCQGFCCLAFSMTTTKSGWRKYIRETKARIQDHLAARERRLFIQRFYHGVANPVVDPEIEDRLERDIAYLKEARMMYNMLIPLKTTSLLGKDQRGRKPNVFTCKHFNTQLHRCDNYHNRPSMCRKFLCHTARLGSPPPIEDMHAHPDRVPSVADKLAITWKPLSKPTEK